MTLDGFNGRPLAMPPRPIAFHVNTMNTMNAHPAFGWANRVVMPAAADHVRPSSFRTWCDVMLAKTDPHLPPGFARLAWSNLAARSAEQISLAAAPIVAVLALGAGAGETGLLQTAQTLPYLLLAIPAGIMADRMARRRLMASAEALRAVALAVILSLTVLGELSVPLLALLGFIGACGTVVYSVAAPALVPSLV